MSVCVVRVRVRCVNVRGYVRERECERQYVCVNVRGYVCECERACV